MVLSDVLIHLLVYSKAFSPFLLLQQGSLPSSDSGSRSSRSGPNKHLPIMGAAPLGKYMGVEPKIGVVVPPNHPFLF